MFICIESSISILPELDKKLVNYPFKRLKWNFFDKFEKFLFYFLENYGYFHYIPQVSISIKLL